MSALLTQLSRWSIRHPATVLILVALATVAAATGLGRLELRTDGRALTPEDAAATIADREIREQFGVRDPIAVVIRAGDSGTIFEPSTLHSIEDLTASLLRIEGIRPHDVSSLATERGFRRGEGVMAFHGMLEPFPETPEGLERLRDELRRIRVYDGILVSRDGTSAAILVDVPPESDRLELVQEIRRLAADSATVVGAPVAEVLLGRHILADLGVPRAVLGDRSVDESSSWRPGAVPVAAAVMALVFLLAFRRFAAAALPLVEAGVCLAIVFGVMGWCGVPVYLTTTVMPVVLISIGIADEVHIFRRYRELERGARRTGQEHRVVVEDTIGELAPPVFATSLTTAVAFLSFGLSPIGPVRAFGLFTALGILVCMVLSLTAVPAVLVLLGPRWLCRRTETEDASPVRADPLSVFFRGVARFAVRRRFVVLTLAAVVVLLSLDGVRRVKVQDSWLDGFSADSEFARNTRFFDREFLGSHRLLLAVEADSVEVSGEISSELLDRFEVRIPRPDRSPGLLEGGWIRISQIESPTRGSAAREWSTWIESARVEGDELIVTMPPAGGSARSWLHPVAEEVLRYEIRTEPWLTPPALRQVDALEAFLAGRAGVGGVLGPALYLKTVSFMLAPDSEQSRRLPANPGEARVLWSDYGVVRGGERLRQLVDAGYGRALVSVHLREADFVDTGHLLGEIRDYERKHLEPHGLRLTIGGDLAVSQALIEAVVRTEVRSVLLSLVGILVIASLLNRSIRRGIYSVLPPALAVLANFALMGWLGIPLGVATSMFASMTLGVGVDYAIHLLARHRLAEARVAGSEESATESALATSGPAILIDALAVGLGFGTLVFSQVPSNARLGGLLVASVSGCVTVALLLIPALMVPRQNH